MLTFHNLFRNIVKSRQEKGRQTEERRTKISDF